MKRKICLLFLSVLLLLVCLPLGVSADTGPKPSVRVAFTNMPEDTVFYGTLLSQHKTNGPNAVWNGKAADAHYKENLSWCELDYETWLAFVEYEDSDGYYFLQEGWLCSESGELAWTYYPPTPFKVLLYFPQQGAFAVSEVQERYAFDSYYTVDLSQVELLSDTPAPLVVTSSYDFSGELLSLAARIVLTVIFELALAFAFGLLRRTLALKLLAVNALTQILLNVLLNVINYNKGPLAFVIYYVLLELCVVVAEALLYIYYVKKHPELGISVRRAGLYALFANAFSFGCGMLAAYYIPGIF